ncbi:MAG: hypothetical protein IT214_13625 [Chitinophagaceae bacterium]|nr:hypothetical protein [Chitinophagaceae bacterium]
MKKILPLILVVAVMVSCKQKTSNDQKKTETTSEQHEEHNSVNSELQLNSGAKWKADSGTRAHVSELKSIVDGYEKSGSKDFAPLATRLQESLNSLIDDCKMTGPDHDALHKWLEPLLEKVKELKDDSPANGYSLVKDISEHLDVFQNYFE